MQGKGTVVSFPDPPAGFAWLENSAIGIGSTKTTHNISTSSTEMRRNNRDCRADLRITVLMS